MSVEIDLMGSKGHMHSCSCCTMQNLEGGIIHVDYTINDSSWNCANYCPGTLSWGKRNQYLSSASFLSFNSSVQYLHFFALIPSLIKHSHYASFILTNKWLISLQNLSFHNLQINKEGIVGNVALTLEFQAGVRQRLALALKSIRHPPHLLEIKGRI